MTEKTIPWALVVESDQLKSARTGQFYEVTRTRKVGDKYEITVTDVAPFLRPTPAEPMAVVKRGATGVVVDLFEVVFSGEKS